jgi:hypothetical protein
MYNELAMGYTIENHEQITLFGEFGQETAEQNFLRLISSRHKESQISRYWKEGQ